MGQQCSEMRDQFTDKILEQQSTAVRGSNTIQPTDVDTLLADHHQQGPTKVYLLLLDHPNNTYTSCYIMKVYFKNYAFLS